MAAVAFPASMARVPVATVQEQWRGALGRAGGGGGGQPRVRVPLQLCPLAEEAVGGAARPALLGVGDQAGASGDIAGVGHVGAQRLGGVQRDCGQHACPPARLRAARAGSRYHASSEKAWRVEDNLLTSQPADLLLGVPAERLCLHVARNPLVAPPAAEVATHPARRLRGRAAPPPRASGVGVGDAVGLWRARQESAVGRGAGATSLPRRSACAARAMQGFVCVCEFVRVCMRTCLVRCAHADVKRWSAAPDVAEWAAQRCRVEVQEWVAR